MVTFWLFSFCNKWHQLSWMFLIILQCQIKLASRWMHDMPMLGQKEAVGSWSAPDPFFESEKKRTWWANVVISPSKFMELHEEKSPQCSEFQNPTHWSLRLVTQVMIKSSTDTDITKCYQTESKSWRNYVGLTYIDSLSVWMSGIFFIKKEKKVMTLFT